MRTYKTSILLILLVFLGSISKAQDTLTLSECIDYALEHHLSIENSIIDEEAADLDINETRASGLPQVDGSADFMASPKIQSQFVPEDAFSPFGDPDRVVPLAFGVPFSSDAHVEVTQLLYSNTFFVGLEAAKTYKKLSEQNTQFTKQDVVLNVTKAYYGVLVNQHRKELYNANKSQLDKLLSDATVMFDAGMIESIELTKIQVSINNLITEIEKVNSLDVVSRNLLKFNMGMALSEPLLLGDSLEGLLSSSDTASIPGLNPEERLDYQILQSQLELTDLNVSNEKSRAVPTAVAFGRVGANNGAINFEDLPKFGNWESYAFVGIQLNVPIFSSGQKKNRVEKAKLDQVKLLNQMEQAVSGYELEYSELKENFKNYLASLERQQINLDMAQLVYEDAQIKYVEGTGTNADIVSAQTSLKEAQVNYLATVYDLLITQVDLDKCTGNLISE